MQIQQLKLYLKKEKISYEKLSSMSGIPLNTLKNIFSGRTPNPRIDTMQAIEAALELNQPIGFTDEEKALGIVTDYKEKLTEDETELIDLYRALKDEKGQATANAVRTMIRTLIDGKK